MRIKDKKIQYYAGSLNIFFFIWEGGESSHKKNIGEIA